MEREVRDVAQFFIPVFFVSVGAAINFRSITPRVLMDAMAAGGAEAKRAFTAMMDMGKIDVAKIEAARRG